jgi:hypothetical protein
MLYASERSAGGLTARDGNPDNEGGSWDKKARPRKLCAYRLELQVQLSGIEN